MNLLTKIFGAEIESSSIDSISGQGSLDAKIQSVSIDQVAGVAKLRSRLESGNIRISFSPHFDWGMSFVGLAESSLDDPTDQSLRDAGFSDEQITKIAEIVGKVPLDIETGGTKALDSRIVIGDQVHEISSKFLADSLSFDLPNIPINLDQEVDVKNLKIDALSANGKPLIDIGRVEATPKSLGDLQYTTSAPDILKFASAEINETRLKPIDIPKLNLPDLETSIRIDKLGSSDIPLDIESTNGSSDINLPLVDWHPRWREEICIKVWKYKKCAYVEFGIDLNISLYYRWSISLLKFSIAIRNAFANGIDITVKATSVALHVVHIGLLKALKVVSSFI